MRHGSGLNASLPKSVPTHVPTGSLVTVTIGRNIGSLPMPEPRWAAFKAELVSYLQTFCGTVFGPFEGEGEWDGVTETSAVVTALVHYPANPVNIDATLKLLAESFEQDAIAWAYGESRLVGPNV